MPQFIKTETEFEYLSNPKNFPVRQYEMKCKHCENMVWRRMCFAGKAVCENCRRRKMREWVKKYNANK